MKNVEAARQVLEEVLQLGVREFCACSGSRNAPLLAILGASHDPRVYSFVDERSAAFFALGRAKLTGRPAAVVTTSGTAVAELLPAAIEAHYSGLPVVFITADRPRRYRGSGAPQAIEQEDLLGRYAAKSIDRWNAASALHLNVEFDEPLIDGAVEAISLRDTSMEHRLSAGIAAFSTEKREIRFSHPVAIVGELRSSHTAIVRDFLLRLGAPVFAEPLSGLREDEALRDLLLTSGERILKRGGFDGVIRIGGVPTLRYWRDLDESLADLPVTSFATLPFAGLSRGEVHPLDVLASVTVRRSDRDEPLFALDREIRARFEAVLDKEPQSELAIFRDLSTIAPTGSRIYLGNSLPIREWDLAATRDDRRFVVAANRGANGIDGQLSTFFGQCDPAVENIAIIGDLTALYDLNAPWIVPQLDGDTRFRIFIVNNRGGRIFERVGSLRALDESVRSRVIDNVHDLRFDAWASMFGITSHVRELRPDLDASRRVWREYEALWE